VPWDKGKSGNPGGYSKSAREANERMRVVLQAAADLKAADGNGSKLIADRLVEIIRNGEPRESLKAIEIWLERVHGKVKDHVELSGAMTEDQAALLEAWRMTPHERRKALEAEALDDAPLPDDFE